MALAGYNVTTSVATAATSTTYSAVDGNMSFSLSDSNDLLDITDFADGRFRRRIVGLRDLSATLDGDVETTDTAYLKMKAAYNAGNPIYLQITADGTNGIIVPMLIESLERNASVEGKIEISVSMSLEGNIDPFEVGTGM
jgi:predicted secreted protein